MLLQNYTSFKQWSYTQKSSISQSKKIKMKEIYFFVFKLLEKKIYKSISKNVHSAKVKLFTFWYYSYIAIVCSLINLNKINSINGNEVKKEKDEFVFAGDCFFSPSWKPHVHFDKWFFSSFSSAHRFCRMEKL